MSDPTLGITANSMRAEQELDRMQQRSNTVSASIIANSRKTAEIGLQMVAAFGIALDAQYRLAIEAGLRTIEFIAAAQTAIAAGTLGLGTVLSLGLQFASIMALVSAIAAMRQGRRDTAAQLQATSNVLRYLNTY